MPDHISLRSLRLALVQPLQIYANTRPARILRGTTSPFPPYIHALKTWTGSPYVNTRRVNMLSKAAELTLVKHGSQTKVVICARHGVERLMCFAFVEASKRLRNKLCVAKKGSAQQCGLVLMDGVAAAVSKKYPSVTWDKMLVYAMATRMVVHSSTLDTIVATNLHADILSDLVASLAKSIGIAPTSNLDPTVEEPSMLGISWERV